MTEGEERPLDYGRKEREVPPLLRYGRDDRLRRNVLKNQFDSFRNVRESLGDRLSLGITARKGRANHHVPPVMISIF